MNRALLLVLLVPLQAWAQYAGPAVEACRSYAERQYRQDSGKNATVVFENDRHLGIDRYTKKVGSQFVSSILYGNGSMVTPDVQAAEMSFVCLLADDKRPVFFFWSLRQDAATLAQCTRSPVLRKNAATCIDALMQVTEQDMMQAYASRFQEARDIDAKSRNEAASNAFRKSNDAWRAYRDAECARRGIGDAQKACLVDLSRRRLQDLR